MWGKTLLTLLSAALLAVLAGCKERGGKPNQQTPLASPSGTYVLKMPIEKVSGQHYWRLEISDSTGTLLYKDKEGFAGQFNVYWCWDAQDRVWLYNSDDGKVWF